MDTDVKITKIKGDAETEIEREEERVRESLPVHPISGGFAHVNLCRLEIW